MDGTKMELIKQYFSQTHFVDHHVDTFNHFISHGMQAIVDREPTLRVTAVDSDTVTTLIKFGQVYVDRPKFIHPNRSIQSLMPNEARQRNATYDGTIFATIKVINLETKQTTIHDQVPIGKMPIMVRSNVCNLTNNNSIDNKECSNDHGGYFIIKGKERVLVGQLRRQYNKVYVEHDPSEKLPFTAELRSMNDQGASVLVQLKYNSSTHELFFSLPYIKTLVPAGLVFKAVGLTEDDMFRWVDEPLVQKTLIDQFNQEATKQEALEVISSDLNDETKTVEFVEAILKKEILHHVGAVTHEKVGHQMSYMIRKLLATASGRRALDDKDNMANKRLDGTSSLLAFLFQGLFKQFAKTVVNQLKTKKVHEPINIIKNTNNITNGLLMGFVTGNWNTQKSATFTRIGVSQVLSMQNFGARISHLRRIMMPIGKKGKNPTIRQLHSSHFSFICPYETPEGETVGIVSNLALSVRVSCGVNKEETERVIERMVTFRPDVDGKTLILHNGCILGSCDRGVAFFQEFCRFRASDMIDDSVSIVWLRDENEIHIQSDEGRLLRPLFALTRNQAPLIDGASWNDLVDQGVIVFRDVWELEQSVVAMTVEDLKKNRCDYLEICPAATMMAIMASVIPLSNHSQSPRNAYQASMGKQAIGFPSEAFQHRFDTTLHVLDTPQKPITRNEMVNVLHFNEMSHGVNPIVAIMTFTGFNQEDSVILNRSAIERGLFTATTYKTIIEEEKKRGNSDFESICLPKFQYRNRNHDYSFLNEQGLVWKKNTWLKKGAVIIGKTSNKMVRRPDGSRALETTDTSVTIKHGEEGFLDAVLDTFNSDGIRIIKVRVRIPRFPEIGDKFASSTAQKGTCGMVFAQEDMPFDKNGITPDLIINPHAIPSRMTINMLIEMCFNLVGCKLGREMDATPFQHNNIEQELQDWAQKAGLDSYMSDMYSGFTGERYPSKIFMAPCFYQRLKHMVMDKIHARVAGPLDTLTHQPVAGRSRDGGLRFGEMEKDCMLSHGSTRILKECLFDKSDKYTIPVCTDCGNVPNRRTYCTTCESENIEMKNMPYATKLLYQELLGMGIRMKIN